MTIIEYPKWMYHADGRSCVIGSLQEHDGLGEGWFESPVVAADYHAEMMTASLAARPSEPEPEAPKGKK